MDRIIPILCAAAAGLAACTKSLPNIVDASEDARGTLVAEGPGGQWLRWPCQLTIHEVSNGTSTTRLAVLLEQDAESSIRGTYRGLSGAPILGSNGEYLGVNSGQFWGSYGLPVFGIATDREAAVALTQGRRLGTRLSNAPPIEPRGETLRDGASIAAMGVWGAIRIGVTGHLYRRFGNEALLFGHTIEPNASGPCMYALVRVPVLGVVPYLGQYEKVGSLGPVVGAVTYQGDRSCYAVLGVAPPTAAIRIAFQRGKIAERPLEFTVVKCPRKAHEWLSSIVDATLHYFDLYDGVLKDSPVRIRVHAPEGDLVEEGGAPLREKLLRTLENHVLRQDWTTCNLTVEMR